MSQRKEYRRMWMARRRLVIPAKKKAARTVTLSSDSETDSDEQMNLNVELPSACKATNDVCVDALDGFSVEPSGNSASCELNWDVIDNECLQGSESDMESDASMDNSLLQELQTWSADCDVPHSQLNKLLPILHKYHSELPLTAKTLLKTPQQQVIECTSLSGGDYVYFGLYKGLCEAFSGSEHLLSAVHEIKLAFNVDGVPVFSSSSYSLWPLLCYAMNVRPYKVFIVAVYGGKSKPHDLMFLQQAVDELKSLMDAGLCINGNKLKCIPVMCVCDAVARAMVKCVKQYSGYYGCDKCAQKGEYVGRMTYPECNALLRNDSSFRSFANSQHHVGVSPFCSLAVDMIAFFPVDYMHQVCLGVMKRLLLCWTVGDKKSKLSCSQKAQVNVRISQFRLCVSKEFSRKPRSLHELAHWKATEFRTFLLYAGYFVLHGIINDDLLQHFMCLSVGMAILVSESLSSDAVHRQFAHDLLVYFVQRAMQLYGPQFAVYNVHSLTHLSLEAEHFGKLDNSSAFIFENFMQQLKKLVRSGRNPVVQIANRVREKNFFSSLTSPTLVLTTCLGNYSCQPPDNSCILESGQCCQVVRVENDNVLCLTFKESNPVYSSPCDSRILGVHRVRLCTGKLKHMPINTMASKALSFSDHNQLELVFLQLLHNV